jgi:hypothetical protein
VLLWAFGLATTLLLLGLWGRAVTHDQPTVLDAARTAVDAEIATDRIYSWRESGIVASADIDPVTAQRAVSELREHPEVDTAIGSLVDQFIGALFSNEGEEATVNVSEALVPVVPLIVSGLAAQGIAIDEAILSAALDEAEAIDLETGEIATVARVVDDARALLSLIVIFSVLALMFSGIGAVWLSTKKMEMARTLATRIVLSSVSFAILFRVGSWALDPHGGGSPIAGAGSILLESNVDIFLLVAAGAALIAVGFGWVVRQRRNAGTRPDGDGSESDTRELVRI